MKTATVKIVSIFILLFCVASFSITIAGPGQSKFHWSNGPVYEVKVTNLTRGTNFAPILVASHKAGLSLFELGEPASMQIKTLAELGNPGPLNDLIQPYVYESVITGGLAPGESVTATVATRGRFDYISVAGMLVPTNDGFFAINGVDGPIGNQSTVLYSPGYDAGTEANDEICIDAVDGPCGAEGPGAEGYVHIHAGIHGVGTLSPAESDWRNPVARIEIRRIP
jgi:hypothetical protein